MENFCEYLKRRGCHKDIAIKITREMPKIWRLMVLRMKRGNKIIKLRENTQRRIMGELGAEGMIEIMKRIREEGCTWDSLTCANAALNGHLETLKWARANGCEWDSYTCASATENGHLETLKWARANGCEWDSLTCASAAGNGHLETLKWLRKNGCEWD